MFLSVCPSVRLWKKAFLDNRRTVSKWKMSDYLRRLKYNFQNQYTLNKFCHCRNRRRHHGTSTHHIITNPRFSIFKIFWRQTDNVIIYKDDYLSSKNRPPVSNIDPWTTHTRSLCIVVSCTCFFYSCPCNMTLSISYS